jgi:branched-chain amino acid transport system substrate-binding protein
VARAFTTAVWFALAAVSWAGADEPYKRMLDDSLIFTGTETLPSDRGARNEIVIGLFAPDDDDQPVGRDMARGASLAVKQANATGGIDGRSIRIVRRWADDPWGAGSKDVIRLVFSDGAIALIGGPDGASTHVAQQVATKAHIPLIAPISSDPSLTHTRVPWIFRLAPDDGRQARVLIDEVVAPLGLERIGLVTSTDHDGRTAATELLSALAHSGHPAAFHLEIGSTDAGPDRIAERISAFEPDGLVLRLPPDAIRSLAAALTAADVRAPIFLPWVPGFDPREFPVDAPGGFHALAPFEPARSCGRGLKLGRAYIAAHGERPTAAAAYGYDAAAIVIDALHSGARGRIELRDAIARLPTWEGATGIFEWNTGGGNAAGRPVSIDFSPSRGSGTARP